MTELLGQRCGKICNQIIISHSLLWCLCLNSAWNGLGAHLSDWYQPRSFLLCCDDCFSWRLPANGPFQQRWPQLWTRCSSAQFGLGAHPLQQCLVWTGCPPVLAVPTMDWVPTRSRSAYFGLVARPLSQDWVPTRTSNALGAHPFQQCFGCPPIQSSSAAYNTLGRIGCHTFQRCLVWTGYPPVLAVLWVPICSSSAYLYQVPTRSSSANLYQVPTRSSTAYLHQVPTRSSSAQTGCPTVLAR